MRKLTWIVLALALSVMLSPVICMAAINNEVSPLPVNAQNELSNAVFRNDVQKVNELISKGADVNAKDSTGLGPLYWAVMKGYTEITKLLIDKGANVNTAYTFRSDTPLKVASYHNNTEIIKLLIDKGADVNAKDFAGRTPLWWAANDGCTENAKLLIEKGADVNVKDSYGATALSVAESKGHPDIAQLLRESGAK